MSVHNFLQCTECELIYDDRSFFATATVCKLCHDAKDLSVTHPLLRAISTAARLISDRHHTKHHITDEFVLNMWERQMGKCYFSDFPMTSKDRGPNEVCLVRINDKLGYIPENCVLACRVVYKLRTMAGNTDNLEKIIKGYYENRQLQD